MWVRLERAARLLAWGAAAALAFAAAVSLADILLRSGGRLFGVLLGQTIGIGVIGVVDLVQLAIVTCAWLAIPWAFATRAHVTVDLLWDHLPRPLRDLLGAVTSGAASLFLLLTLRFCVDQALAVQAYGDRSATLQIPLLWYWVPILFGLSLSVAITFGQTVGRLARFLAESRGRR